MSKHELVVPTNNLPAWVYLHEENQSTFIEPHWHSSVELSYTISGHIANFFIANTPYMTEPGTILVVNTMEVHSIRTYRSPDGESRAISIIFPYSLLKMYQPDISDYKILINDFSGEKDCRYEAYCQLQEKLNALADCYHGKDTLRKSILILEILELLLKHFLVKRHLSLSDRNDDKQKERLSNIKSFLEENYRAEITLDDVAEHCYLSKEHLSRFFKEQMAITVFQYLNYIRAKHAKPLLLKTKKTATQIAQECGFSGLRTMDRALQKVYGLSSRELRKQHINQSPKSAK
ncbi:AraC family transcriptional regulator [Streptococcus hillyeri]|uniref:AraC family transcriptional regulator n=1 Tax=Streptococcus hillyeri TaxID=2282420 RepID=A0A3L9DUQ0_9STRE|nr:AraC family transcriptional regulator [Streptococcus hillyeri]RLY03968.1 AraC family transcriptional regulator [Streptococcus hillyeri]